MHGRDEIFEFQVEGLHSFRALRRFSLHDVNGYKIGISPLPPPYIDRDADIKDEEDADQTVYATGRRLA